MRPSYSIVPAATVRRLVCACVLLNGIASYQEFRNGAYGEAEPLYRRALEGLEAKLGVEHPDTVIVRKNWEHCVAAMG